MQFQCNLWRQGKAALSYTAGGKTYKQYFEVLKYENPLKSLKITGVNGGKELKNKFKTKNYLDQTVKSDGGKVTVKAASGWKITQVSWQNNTNQDDIVNGSRYYGAKPRSSASFSLGKMKQGDAGRIKIYLTNTKTGGTQSITVTVGNANVPVPGV